MPPRGALDAVHVPHAGAVALLRRHLVGHPDEQARELAGAAPCSDTSGIAGAACSEPTRLPRAYVPASRISGRRVLNPRPFVVICSSAQRFLRLSTTPSGTTAASTKYGARSLRPDTVPSRVCGPVPSAARAA
jgi:hypothetical protein